MTIGLALHDIVTTAQRDGSFKILVKTFRATGLLAKLLDPKATFTLFAPSDRAFKTLVPGGVLKDLLKDKALLMKVISYHVIPGRRVTSRQAADQRRLFKTLGGQQVMLNGYDGFRVNNARIVKCDIECANGIMHEIDSVLMPK